MGGAFIFGDLAAPTRAVLRLQAMKPDQTNNTSIDE